MKNKRIIVLIPVVLLVVILVIVGAGMIFGNKSQSVTSPVTCAWCGGTDVSYQRYDEVNKTHIFKCNSCNIDTPDDFSIKWDDHVGGEHKNGGKCIYCGERYQTHSAKLDKFNDPIIEGYEPIIGRFKT